MLINSQKIFLNHFIEKIPLFDDKKKIIIRKYR